MCIPKIEFSKAALTDFSFFLESSNTILTWLKKRSQTSEVRVTTLSTSFSPLIFEHNRVVEHNQLVGFEYRLDIVCQLSCHIAFKSIKLLKTYISRDVFFYEMN